MRQVEGYFPEQRDRTSWIRLEENRGLLILRTIGPEEEREDQTEVPVAHAHALLDVCAGEIDYIRTKLPIGDRAVLVDRVIQPLALHFVTVEFETEAEARSFRTPAWFGPEITGDPRYTNQSIAVRRLNEVLEIPLSNEALISLIDTLDNRFPVQSRVPVGRSTPAKAAESNPPASRNRTSGSATKASLDEIEAAMMREMELTLRKPRT